MAKKNEKQNIDALRDELEEAQKITVGIKSKDGVISKVVSGRLSAGLYSDVKRMDALINDLQKELDGRIAKYGNQGWSRGKKKLDEFIDAGMRRDATERRRLQISRLTNKNSAARMDVVYTQLEKEKGILLADIEIFKKNAKIAGFSDKEILQQLVNADKEGVGLVAEFEKRVQKLADAAIRREMSQSEIDAYREEYPDNTVYQWITVSVNPCPDCQARAGAVMSYLEWEKIGTPGSGQTICGQFCLCRLMPEVLSNEMFPTVKEFTWNRNTLVLTPSNVAKKLEKAAE